MATLFKFDFISIPIKLIWFFFSSFDLINWQTEYHRCIHPKNKRNMFEFTKIMRIKVCWINRSYAYFACPTQSSIEHAGSGWVSSIHRFGLSSIGQSKIIFVVNNLALHGVFISFYFVLLKNCKYLERMDLEECNQITDLTLAHLATGCPSLEKLVNNDHSNFP